MKAALRKIHGEMIFDRRVEVLAHELAKLLPQNASVVDVGCGDGTVASLCLAKRPDIAIEGIDVMVRPHTKVSVRPFDGRTLPFADQSRDVVMFVDVLHHTDAPAKLIREATRVARKAVIIKDHVADNGFDFAVLALMDWVGNAPHGVVLPYNYLSQRGWDRILGEEKLQPEAVLKHVPLYPFPLDLLFGRNLHFIGRYAAKPEYKAVA